MPLFRQWNTEGGGVWGIWKVTESFTELRDQLSAVLPYDEELQAMKSASRRMEYVAVRVLLKTLLGKEYSILHYPSGKPFLENETLRISISHTKGYVAVGVHARQEVGIDIEQRTEKFVRSVPGLFGRMKCRERLWFQRKNGCRCCCFIGRLRKPYIN